MIFQYQRVPESKKDAYDWGQFFNYPPGYAPGSWAISEEADIFLAYFGGFGPFISNQLYFGLFLKGSYIRVAIKVYWFNTKEDRRVATIGFYGGTLQYLLRVVAFFQGYEENLSQNLQNKKFEIEEIFKSALMAYADGVGSRVKIEIDESAFNVEESFLCVPEEDDMPCPY
ncbi:MAG: hypothetical protein JO142_13565 [Burkholderiales bacterium]|nr:hypothetical protein [Burkholderiales bacterium]